LPNRRRITTLKEQKQILRRSTPQNDMLTQSLRLMEASIQNPMKTGATINQAFKRFKPFKSFHPPEKRASADGLKIR
jgi:hypothetical protein